MPDKKPLPVLWTNSSLDNARSIKKYLLHKFTQKEVNVFFALLIAFEKAVSLFPKLYPVSSQQRQIRRAVLSKELSAFYKISKNGIHVLALIDNRCDSSEWH
ncbi:MAG: hypothetical protein POELPBGB_02614 [Bacteroidia bacterium]|nr:hypothetical protein [Bacteroidia bacterium]